MAGVLQARHWTARQWEVRSSLSSLKGNYATGFEGELSDGKIAGAPYSYVSNF
jgi:hypothetical protein